jgi:DNA-binding NarL/FixJ family response regulator
MLYAQSMAPNFTIPERRGYHGLMEKIRVLLAEDFAPFRHFVCSTLSQRPNLQIVAEVSDGQEAVQKAKELETDLMLLDVGLPKLNGIAAARQIRNFIPHAKIIFVTQESCAEIAEEAFNSGGRGYVVKARAGTDLLAAVDAILEGRLFISCGVRFIPSEG